MPRRPLAHEESLELLQRMKSCSRRKWKTGEEGAVLTLLTETARDHEHAKTAAEFAIEKGNQFAGPETVRKMLQQTGPQKPFEWGWKKADEIIDYFDHDFLALESVPDAGAPVTDQSGTFWSSLGLRDDDPLFYRFNPAPPVGTTGHPDCTFNALLSKPVRKNAPIDKRYDCYCARCLVRRDWGPAEVWGLAYHWAKTHNREGDRVDQYHPVAERVGYEQFETALDKWNRSHMDRYREEWDIMLATATPELDVDALVGDCPF